MSPNRYAVYKHIMQPCILIAGNCSYWEYVEFWTWGGGPWIYSPINLLLEGNKGQISPIIVLS